MRTLLVALLVAGCSETKPASPPPPAPAPTKQNPFETFATTSPRVGEQAPAFTLRDLAGTEVRLADAVARGPVVLVSGSFSCPLFRMKTPRFEDLAARWKDKATFLFIYGEEAHPRAGGSERLNGFSERMRTLDKDGDRAITLAEYGTTGPRYMFDAMDVDRDGIVRSHELIATKRIDQFAQIDAPKNLDERTALARRFRTEVPGTIPVLIDPFDNPTLEVYGELPNFAYVISADGKVAFKQGWAAVNDVDRELQRLLGAKPPLPTAAPDLALLAEARTRGKPILVELVAPGCDACERMETVLAEPTVQQALASYERVRLSVDDDAAWRLFESLELGGTPAFIHVSADGTLGARTQGLQSREAFLAFVTDEHAPTAK